MKVICSLQNCKIKAKLKEILKLNPFLHKWGKGKVYLLLWVYSGVLHMICLMAVFTTPVLRCWKGIMNSKIMKRLFGKVKNM